MPQEFEKQLEALRQRFIGSLNERAQHLDNIWGYLRHMNWSTQGFNALQQFVHKQSEAGASYGLPELRDAAQQLEAFLAELQELERSFGGQEYAQLEEHVKHLARAMTATAQGITTKDSLPAPIEKQAYPEAEGKLVFLIDPDRTLAALCSAYLRRVGFAVEYFETPQQCVQRLYEELPSIVLMDPNFEREGLQALSNLHQLKTLLPPTSPVVLMSGRTDVNAKLRALRAGSSDYLSKPLDMNLLIERLVQIIGQHNHTHRVMVVDDDPDMASLESEILRYAGMDVICVQQPLQSLQQAAQFKPDLVVLDMHMPDINGMELAVLLRQDPQFLLLPIVFVTADTDTNLHDNIKALGVNAIITKPFEATDLINTCEQALNQTSALKSRVARVTRHTQLPQKINRSYFFSVLEDEIQSGSQGQHTSALYYISVSNLDELSQQLGMVELITLHDQFCRQLDDCIGSDEQWIDLSNMVTCVLAGKRSTEFHQQRAEQLKRHLAAHRYLAGGEPIQLAVGIGIAPLRASLGTANQALIEAEQDFEAKVPGKTPSAATSQSKDLTSAAPADEIINIPVLTKVEPDFSQIVFSRDLSLAFQPIISLEDSRIEHFSVLLRLKGEGGEAIAAKQFLSRISKPSQRIELDRWVLQQAVSAIANNSATREQATLFIHLAEDTLQQSTFFSFAANVLRSSRLRGSERLVFMLEENWVINHLHQTREITKALHNIQCGICLTRAGENPGILEVIDQLALDYLRLSPNLTSSGTNPELLKNLVSAANAKAVKVIATQIENSRNLSSLWMQGVRLFEGFFIQPPDQGFHLQNDIIFAKEFVQGNGFSN
ncbi:REC domain-containing phosphodiesterase [Cellvibrio fontiphilus]|uniref:REC domain-containing phosphodiesterase n=1 Tax=Cellvibrio fontiphilus TaxID=1815559 RepID=A0ABV7FBT1_9GAMM